MTLYYNKNTYELKDLPSELISAWEQADNPKKNEWILAPIKPQENAIWNNGSWLIPQIEIPQTISARQIRLWLINHNFSLSQIELAINNIEDLLIRETVRIEWEYAPYVERSHPWLIPLAQSLGLNEEQIDQAFREASLI
jgi:hypothetical protein